MASDNPYADIMDMEYHPSQHHRHMSMIQRAAQFSPFAALSGFDSVINETRRTTDEQTELSECDAELLTLKLTTIDHAIYAGRHPTITVEYFIPDMSKSGGSYREYSGTVKKIDTAQRAIIFYAANGRSNGERIYIPDIREIHGDIADEIDDQMVS